jgi:hypothetical protein
MESTVETFPGSSILTTICFLFSRGIPKVRKTQHQNPEFGHTWGEIEKYLEKHILAFNGG